MRSTIQRVPLSVNSLLERAGRIYPQSEIHSRLPDKSLHRYRFADFYRRSRQLAAALLAAGLKKGDRVATLSWNHYAHLECYFGIPAAGGVTHTLNLRLAADELAWIVNHAADRFLVVDDVLLPLLEQFRAKVAFERIIVVPLTGAPVQTPFIDYEKFLVEAPATFEYPEHDENDPVAMCYTSGTTGRPKGVVYSHRSVVLHTLASNQPDLFGLKGSDSVMPVTPMFHANCWGVPYVAVMMGVKLIFPGPHLGAADLLDLFASEQPTYSLGVPTIWISILQLLDSNPLRYRLPTGVRMLVGGSAVPESLIRGFARHGATVVQGWGMTETGPLGSVAFIKPELQHLGEEQRRRLSTAAGVPAPLVDVRIVGDEQERAWDGRSVGEIQVRGPFITGRYHDVPADADKFTTDGWLRTGDVATVDPHAYIRIVDRTKDLIKSGGEWISSVDMENSLMGHPAVAEAAVIAIPDEKWSERPLACVVFRNGSGASPDELREHIANSGQFARWQLPDRFEVLAAIPRTSTGKFWKARLRELFKA